MIWAVGLHHKLSVDFTGIVEIGDLNRGGGHKIHMSLVVIEDNGTLWSGV